MEKIAAVILAAGKGTRMGNVEGSEIPKVMFKVLNQPIIRYGVDNIKAAGVTRVVLVVGYKQEMIRDYFGDEVEYAVQDSLLGTGDAVKAARDKLINQSDAVMVGYGDHVLYKPSTIRNLIAVYEQKRPAIAMLTVNFEDPTTWGFGRIVRDKEGKISQIVEQKDCTPEQLKIKESNPAFYIFNADWLWANIDKLEPTNIQKEYYLTDLIGIAIGQGESVVTVTMKEEDEARGINTLEQLREVERVLTHRKDNYGDV